MVSKNKVMSATVIAILFASAVAGTIAYYNDVVKQENSKIASLNNQMASLNNQIANQNKEIANLNNQISLDNNPRILTKIGVAEIGGTHLIRTVLHTGDSSFKVQQLMWET